MDVVFNPSRPPSKDESYARRFAWELIKGNLHDGVFDVWVDPDDDLQELKAQLMSFGCAVRIVREDTLRVVPPPRSQ